MKLNWKKAFLVSIVLVTTRLLPAQVLLKASADKDHILVGEPLQLTLEARLPLGEKLDWVLLDSISHFEWIDKGNPTETNDVDGKKVLQTASLTSYDTGYWVIPAFSIRVANRNYYSDTLGLRVDYSPGFDPSADYRDIKETEAVVLPNRSTWEWWLFAVVLLLAILGWFWWRRKNRKKHLQQITVAEPPLSILEKALRQLDVLRREQPASASEVKEFYIRLNDVLRNYLNQQFRISTLEKTNDELIPEIKQLKLSGEEYRQTVEALHLADYVKFARYLPATSQHTHSVNVIETCIQSLHKAAAAT